MKLRLRQNSIRLRLLQNEVRQLLETGSISETIAFGIDTSENLTYSLRNSEEAADIFAKVADNHIEVFLPIKMAEAWADTEEIGLYAEQKIRDTTDLKIVIEKDLVCLDRPEDPDNKDAFLHPKTKC